MFENLTLSIVFYIGQPCLSVEDNISLCFILLLVEVNMAVSRNSWGNVCDLRLSLLRECKIQWSFSQQSQQHLD